MKIKCKEHSIKLTKAIQYATLVLNKSEFLTLLTIAFLSQKDSSGMYYSCFYNTESISKETGIKPKTISNIISKLNKKGFIQRHDKYKRYYSVNKEYIVTNPRSN